MKKIARFLSRRDGTGEGRVYELTPPLDGHKYVWVSAVVAMFSGPETFIFASNRRGDVSDWEELPGSIKGVLDHEAALKEAGYTVVKPKAKKA